MGQQQLLLVVLVVIVIGISTLIAVNIFGTAINFANRDAITQDLYYAAANVQTVWGKPEFMAGAGKNFENLNDSYLLEIMNIPSNSYQAGDLTITNDNGSYSIVGKSERSLSLLGTQENGQYSFRLTITWDEESKIWITEIEEIDS